MREVACDFAESGRLKGVLTLPERKLASPVALVLISAGFTSKCGPYGLYTQLARQLAHHGITTFRFDLSGIADSQTIINSLPLEERTALDIKAALDYLRVEHARREFIVGGLCSGAEDALRCAAGDNRVRGVLMIDPHAFRTLSWYLRNLFSRQMFNRICLKALKIIRFGSVSRMQRQQREFEELNVDLVDYPYMQREEATRLLNAALGNGAHIHYVYTAGRSATFNHVGQVRRMLPAICFSNRLTVDYIPEIEHTQAFPEDREKLVEVIKSRIVATYSN